MLVLAAQACGTSSAVPADAGDSCQVCATANLCCEARTANPDSNCQLYETCEMFTGEPRARVISGCQDYLRVGSTPPAPLECGPHPDAE